MPRPAPSAGAAVQAQVVAFYDDLFARVFARPLVRTAGDAITRRSVRRQVQALADAASGPLTRLVARHRLDPAAAAAVLADLAPIARCARLADLAAAPPALPAALAAASGAGAEAGPGASGGSAMGAARRAAARLVADALTRAGPVLGAWRRAGLADDFPPLRALAADLAGAADRSGPSAAGAGSADARFELRYRDWLVQHRAAAPTAGFAATGSRPVDLRTLFVPPSLTPVDPRGTRGIAGGMASAGSVGRVEARARPFAPTGPAAPALDAGAATAALWEILARHPRLAIAGPPGSGKSTLLAWLQLVVAGVDLPLVAGGQQAIPLRIPPWGTDGWAGPPTRASDGPTAVARAVAALEVARPMPRGWVERQLEAGRALVLIDGVDAVDALGDHARGEPAAGDGGAADPAALPHPAAWLADLVARYPDCRYVVATGPGTGAPGGALAAGFAVAHLDAFDDARVHAGATRWCTAARLARGEPDVDARRAGRRDGDAVFDACARHPDILGLARRPLWLSAICLAHDAGDRDLPRDRVGLVQRGVEAMLRRAARPGAADVAPNGAGVDADVAPALRACAAVALAARAAARPDLPVSTARRIAATVLGAPGRGAALVDHARRAGVVVDRRRGTVGFAHDAVHDHLAAQAVVHGLRRGWDIPMLLRAPTDPRWRGVVPLCCGLSDVPAARAMIEHLLHAPGDRRLGAVIADTWAAAPPAVRADEGLCLRVVDRLARLPGDTSLEGLPPEAVAPVAHLCVGGTGTAAFAWLLAHPEAVDAVALAGRLRGRRAADCSGILYLVHRYGPDDLLAALARDARTRAAAADARLVLSALAQRAVDGRPTGPGHRAAEAALRRVLRSAAPTVAGHGEPTA